MAGVCIPKKIPPPKVLSRNPKNIDAILFNDDMIITLPVSDDGFNYPHGFESWEQFCSRVTPFMKIVNTYDKNATLAIFGSSIQGYRFKNKKGKDYGSIKNQIMM